MPATALHPRADRETVSALRRELYVFALYRVLEGVLFVFLAYSPLAWSMIDGLRVPWLAYLAAPLYLVVGLVLLALSREARPPVHVQAGVGLACDVLAIGTAMHTLGGAESAAALMLMINVGAGALLMPLRVGIAAAVLAALTVTGQYVWGVLRTPDFDRSLVETVMFTAMYLATATFCHLMGIQTRRAEALAQRRGEDVSNLAEINELILRRMRTGVLVVDSAHQVRVANEAARAAMGHPPGGSRALADLAPELSRRLWHWRNARTTSGDAVALAADAPQVIPHFARMRLEGEELFLCFLDDVSLLSRRAEELTLRALGRLSASIAHEIRNPLAAISHATQLIEESDTLSEGDRRLVEIVYAQCQRLNGIVNNVLALARRERSQPERIDLVRWARGFVDDYRAGHPQAGDGLQAFSDLRHLTALVDPDQLHQAVTVLVDNAMVYGHLPDEAPRVALMTRTAPNGAALLEVVDRGPGIPAAVVERLFEPFYTTSEHGTGLGLYIARELCEANQCTLEYASVPGGGSCFRITLPHGKGLLAGQQN
ncbi:sensor histidine kinase [Coralloluteibacterium thermophilus]|uniref:histidine kinase n=1 Tax=Coralloluteibacterium thermophilum TaxID=2707049 RepID=A0ABV9NHC1_9GAMM